MLTFNYQYRIYPDRSQEEKLIEIMEICRSAYNYALREIKDWCNSRKCPIDRCSLVSEYIISADAKFPSELNQLNRLPKAKKEFPRLKEVPSQVLQQTIKQLHRAWDFFRSRGYGFPRFKKFGQFKSILFPQFKESPLTSSLKLRLRKEGKEGGIWQISLPKIGKVRINVHRPIPEGFKVKQVRVIRKADRWYVSICIQLDVDVPTPLTSPLIGGTEGGGHALGVDIGLEKFLATSDGVLVKPPKFFKKMQSELKLLQRRLSRKQKRCGMHLRFPAGIRFPQGRRSKNYEKQRIKVARMHHKISNTRKDFHYKQAHALCDAGDMIFMEDLDYRITAKGMLGKEMLDGGFGQFRTITQQVCWTPLTSPHFMGGKRGVDVVDARGSSQTCPNCGVHVKKDPRPSPNRIRAGKRGCIPHLSVRVHKCPECKYEADRDVAAASVLKKRGLNLVRRDSSERKQPATDGVSHQERSVGGLVSQS